jgi:hypothetical protein
MTRKYFPDVYDEDGNLTVSDDKLISVSIFDHWLSAEEAENCPVMFYQLAIDRQAEKEYLAGEKCFLAFYNLLSSDGLVVHSDEQLTTITNSDPKFVDLVTDSLREGRLMDVYFPAYEARALGGYDRTDLIIMDNLSRQAEIEDLIEISGLYSLASRFG